jgi:formiminoglutamase
MDGDIDLATHVAIRDEGDVANVDHLEGQQVLGRLVRDRPHNEDLLVLLGGDNAVTYHGLHALASGSWGEWGLITLDAHLDMRDGVSNGSPVRQLLEAGLDGRHVVQIGLADFSNSASYATAARGAGVTLIPRGALRRTDIASVVRDAVRIAGAGGRRIYVDVDVDVVDRAAVPGCPAAAPGGLSADDLRQFVRGLAAESGVRAMDFTEVDVDRDSADERTVRLVATCVLEAAAGVVERKL